MQTKTKNQDVYKITGFSEIVESPVFYLILVLTFILGISSIFGFLQNPRKLKSVVDVINKKVAVYDASSVDNSSQEVNDNRYSILYNLSATSIGSDNSSDPNLELGSASNIDSNRYSILLNDLTADWQSQSSFHVAAFDYNITSKQFWSDLQIDSQDINFYPLSLDGQYKITPFENSILLEESDSKYSIKVGTSRS